MKIGISGRRNQEEQYYKKIKSFGFDYYDFNMTNTDTEPYTLNEKDFYK